MNILKDKKNISILFMFLCVTTAYCAVEDVSTGGPVRTMSLKLLPEKEELSEAEQAVIVDILSLKERPNDKAQTKMIRGNLREVLKKFNSEEKKHLFLNTRAVLSRDTGLIEKFEILKRLSAIGDRKSRQKIINQVQKFVDKDTSSEERILFIRAFSGFAQTADGDQFIEDIKGLSCPLSGAIIFNAAQSWKQDRGEFLDTWKKVLTLPIRRPSLTTLEDFSRLSPEAQKTFSRLLSQATTPDDKEVLLSFLSQSWIDDGKEESRNPAQDNEDMIERMAHCRGSNCTLYNDDLGLLAKHNKKHGRIRLSLFLQEKKMALMQKIQRGINEKIDEKLKEEFLIIAYYHNTAMKDLKKELEKKYDQAYAVKEKEINAWPDPAAVKNHALKELKEEKKSMLSKEIEFISYCKSQTLEKLQADLREKIKGEIEKSHPKSKLQRITLFGAPGNPLIKTGEEGSPFSKNLKNDVFLGGNEEEDEDSYSTSSPSAPPSSPDSDSSSEYAFPG